MVPRLVNNVLFPLRHLADLINPTYFQNAINLLTIAWQQRAAVWKQMENDPAVRVQKGTPQRFFSLESFFNHVLNAMRSLRASSRSWNVKNTNAQKSRHFSLTFNHKGNDATRFRMYLRGARQWSWAAPIVLKAIILF